MIFFLQHGQQLLSYSRYSSRNSSSRGSSRRGRVGDIIDKLDTLHHIIYLYIDDVCHKLTYRNPALINE